MVRPLKQCNTHLESLRLRRILLKAIEHVDESDYFELLSVDTMENFAEDAKLTTLESNYNPEWENVRRIGLRDFLDRLCATATAIDTHCNDAVESPSIRLLHEYLDFQEDLEKISKVVNKITHTFPDFINEKEQAEINKSIDKAHDYAFKEFGEPLGYEKTSVSQYLR